MSQKAERGGFGEAGQWRSTFGGQNFLEASPYLKATFEGLKAGNKGEIMVSYCN